MAKKYLALDEAAEMLGIDPEKLMKARENGDIRGFADRGSWKFRQADLDEFARSLQADSDPEIQILDEGSVLDDDDFSDLSSSDSDVRLQIDDDFGDLGESTSDVRLDDGSDKAGSLSESLSDVRLDGDSGPTLESSDSEVLLVGSDSDSDVRMTDSDSDVRLTGDSDSDVELITESDSDVKLMGDDSDSDVQLIDGLGATDGEITLSDNTDSIEMEVVGDIATPDESSLIMSRDSDMAEDSDLLIAPDDPGSDITLEAPGGSSVLLDDESGITLEAADSGILMGADDSGISLESVDSGLVLDDDSGISLDAGDSGISLDIADSGIALAPMDDDSGIALEAVDQTMPLQIGGVPAGDDLDTTMLESQPGLDDSTGEFELAGLGDDDDEVGMDTSVLLFEDDDDTDSSAGTPITGVAAAAGGAMAAAAGAAALRGSSVDTDDDFEDFDDDEFDDMDDDDDFDDDVFDAADDDFDDGFDAGESQADLAGASAGGVVVQRAAVEHDWGIGWLVTLSIGSILMLLCCMLSFDLVRSMWSWNEPTPVTSTVMDTLGGLFGG